MFKKLKENTTGSPATTKKGVWYTLGIAVIGTVATMLASKHPQLSETITANQEIIYSGIALLSAFVMERFAQRKDAE